MIELAIAGLIIIGIIELLTPKKEPIRVRVRKKNNKGRNNGIRR